ncbi:MAG: DHA2 family efflux MFS transporter permease subunit [Marmoricola sp.]
MTTELTSPPASIPAASDKLDKRVLLTAGVVVLAAIMSILDITVVSVALNTFQNVFHRTSAQVAWTMTGYTLALATVIPLTGWAADRFGTKRLFILAIVLFTLGSALCSTANSLELLVTYRVLQGLGGGMLMPLGMTILTRAAGPERIGRVMAVLGIPMLLGPIFGPILGGWLIDIASWHWIFLINVPVGAIAVAYAWFVLEKDSVAPSESFDFIGMLLLSPGLATLLYGVSSIPAAKQEHGTMWTGQVVIFGAIGIVLTLAFIPWALRRRNIHPLLDLRLFQHKEITIAVLAMMLFAIAFFGAGLLFPLYFQNVHGQSPVNSGWWLAPQGVGAMLTMPLGGVLADKMGPGKIVLTGLVLDTIGMGFFAATSATTGYPFMLAGLIVMGLGMGMTMMPIMSAALAKLDHASIARGSTLMNITQQVASSVGTALFSVLLVNAFQTHPSIAAVAKAGPAATPTQIHQSLTDMGGAFAGVFLIGTILVACCIIPALFLPRTKQEATGISPIPVGH